MLDLIITTDLNSLPAAIEFNYAELKAGVAAYLDNFKNLVVTEDGIKSAERDRANINKMVKAIAAARLDTKKRVLKPFEDFEAKCKELEGMGKDASEALDVQIRAFEQKRIEEKLACVTEWQAEMLAEAFDDEKDLSAPYWQAFLTDNTSLAKKGNWLLKGMTEENVRDAIAAKIAEYKQGVETLATLFGEDAELHAKSLIDFRRTCDFNAVVSLMNRYKKEREEIESAKKARAEAEAKARAEREARLAAQEEARKAREAEESARRAEEQARAATAVPVAPAQPSVEAIEQPPTGGSGQGSPSGEKILTFTLKVSGTLPKLSALNKYMKANGITYEKVC